MAGIVGYGVYVPIYRIRVEEIARVWGEDAESIKKGLGIREKSVPGRDEDAATIAVEAARRAVRHSELSPGARRDIRRVGIAPLRVKPTATIVAQAIEAGNKIMVADLSLHARPAPQEYRWSWA